MLFRIITGLLLLLSIQSSFAFFGPALPSDPVALYELGTTQLEAKKYKKAQKIFEVFLDKHSEHDLIASAKVRLADSFFGREDFKMALKIYERIHLESPYSEEGSHTLFRMGLCNMEFISKHKGNKYIPYAVASFERFLTMYPEHGLIEEAKRNINKAKKSEAEYQLEVGNYYFRHKDYCAAFNHFEKVLVLNDFETHSKVEAYVAQCQQRESCLDEVAACEFDLKEVNTRLK